MGGAAQAKHEDGSQAYIEPVSDPASGGVPWQVVRRGCRPMITGALVLLVADRTTLTSHDHSGWLEPGPFARALPISSFPGVAGEPGLAASSIRLVLPYDFARSRRGWL